MRTSLHAVLLAIAGLMFTPLAQALGTSELLDVVIQAVEPQLQPAKPLILCILDGKNVQKCIEQEIENQAAALQQEGKNQAAAALPFDPNDSRITEIIAVVKAASQGKWLDVISKGGTTVGKIVACAVLPPGAKTVGCPVIDYVMDNNKKIIDDAFTALKGPDWWALATLLGPQTACQFIPVAEIKATLCGPLGAAIEAAVTLAKDGTKVVANALGDASELLVNFTENVSGQDPPMAPEKYYQTYWYVNNHWYVLSAVVMGYSNPPDNMKVQYDHCVGYFDSHKASLDTAKKWCNKMRDQATAQLKVSLAAVKAAPPTYLESTLKPQLPALALKYFHAPASPMPGKLYSDCVYELRDRVPVPGVLPNQNINMGKWGAQPATAWEWACTQVATDFKIMLAAYKNQVMPTFTAKMASAGCKAEPSKNGDTALRFLCESWEGLGTCKTDIAALGGSDEGGYCGIDGTKAASKLAAQIAAQLGAKRCAVAANSPRIVQCTRPWKVTQCKALAEQAQGGSIGYAYAVDCQTKDDPGFLSAKAQVQGILVTLNGGKSANDGPEGTAGEAAAKNDCHTTWDSLAIMCGSPEPIISHQLKLPECAADPNKDGADAPCLALVLYNSFQKGKDVKAGPAFDGPLKGEASSGVVAPGPAIRDAPAVVLPPDQGGMLGTPATIPLTGSRQPATVNIPGCEPVAGMPGHFSCTTAESYTRCERQRMVANSGIRMCQKPAGRLAPAAPGIMSAPTTTTAPLTVPPRLSVPAPVSIPGCEPVAGQPGVFRCLTSEALTVCERQRIAKPMAVRACQAVATRTPR